MAEYYFKKEPLGYHFGILAEDEKLHEGAEAFKDEKSLSKRVKLAEKELEKEIQEFFSDDVVLPEDS